MDVSFRDWVVETSSTTGTGTYSLSGSPPAGTSYFTFRQRYANGNAKVSYWVVSADRTKWEKNRFGTLTYGSPDTLSRDVDESTNGDAAVSWVGGDAPLRLYVVPDADAEEFAISMGLGAARPDVLKYGQWADEDGLATDFDELKHFDGTSDDVYGVVNRVAHKATIYGLPPGHLYGQTLSRSSATVLGIAAGVGMDSTNVVGITLSAFTKSVAGAWASGSGSNGMGNGLTVASGTWYHVFAILNAGAADVYFDTSVSAANKPTNTTHFRRIGSFRTDGSAQIIDFVQDGDLFQWSTGVVDVGVTNPGASAVTRTLTVPTGVNVQAIVQANIFNGSTGVAPLGYFSDLATSDVSAGTLFDTTLSTNTAGGSANTTVRLTIRTNTSAQIRSRLSASDASVGLNIRTLGWIDRRGRDA